jgi:type I restriction enzyme S subunit
MPSEDNIPKHWDLKKAEEACDYIQRGKQPAYDDENGTVNIVNQRCIYWDKFKWDQRRKLDDEERDSWQDYRYLQEGDVLVNSTGKGTLGRAQIFPGHKEPHVVDGHVTIMRSGEKLNYKFLYYYLRSSYGQEQIHTNKSGSTSQTELYKRDVLALELPVPPLDEQREIVKKLDKIFDKINKIEKSQEKADKIFKDIAFSFFTSRVKEAETDTVETDELIESTQYGSSNATNSEGDGYPSLRMGNYNLRGEMDYSKIKYQDLEDDDFEKYRVEKGDVLFNRTNSKDLVGKMCVYDGGLEDAVFASYLIRVELNEDRVLPEYFVTYMNSHLGEVERQGKLKQAVSQANINATELREMEMAVPSLERQKEIVKSLNYMRSKVDDIKSEVDKKGKLIEDMPNSILAEAFKGNLVDFGAMSESDELGSTEQGIDEKQESSFDGEGQQSLGEYR